MAVDFLAQIPPHDLDAEKSALGSILLDNGRLIDVLDTAAPGDFYVEKNRHIFEAMLRLWGDHQPIDGVTLISELRARGRLDAVADGYIAEVAALVPTARNAGYYGAIIHNLALVRDFGRAAYQISIDSLAAQDASEFLTNAQAQLDLVHAHLLGPREPALAESIAAVLADIRENRRPARISTGSAALNDALDGGIGRDELAVLAGLTGRGKSARALNMAVAAARQGVGVLYVSLEMAQAQLAERALCAEARVNLTARLRGLRPDEMARLDDAGRQLAACKLEIKYRPGITPIGLRALAQKFHRDWSTDFGLLVVDYIGLVKSDQREERREREVAATSMALKHLAGELNIAVLALSQFSRAPERREDRTPRLSDLRDSGAVEQDCDICLFLHEKGEDENDERDVDIIVAKNRRGPCWVTVPARFIARQTRFEDLEEKSG